MTATTVNIELTKHNSSEHWPIKSATEAYGKYSEYDLPHNTGSVTPKIEDQDFIAYCQTFCHLCIFYAHVLFQGYSRVLGCGIRFHKILWNLDGLTKFDNIICIVITNNNTQDITWLTSSSLSFVRYAATVSHSELLFSIQPLATSWASLQVKFNLCDVICPHLKQPPLWLLLYISPRLWSLRAGRCHTGSFSY